MNHGKVISITGCHTGLYAGYTRRNSQETYFLPIIAQGILENGDVVLMVPPVEGSAILRFADNVGADWTLSRFYGRDEFKALSASWKAQSVNPLTLPV